jgi:hypothetical protein
MWASDKSQLFRIDAARRGSGRLAGSLDGLHPPLAKMPAPLPGPLSYIYLDAYMLYRVY